MDDNTRSVLLAFAEKHGLIFEERGEVGFGRPCVGFTDGTRYVLTQAQQAKLRDYMRRAS